MGLDGQARGWNLRTQRRIPRYGVHLPLDVTVLRSGIPDKVPGRSVNLSERGVAAVLAAELTTGEAVGVELQVPEAQPLRWRAVVRYQDKLRCGMEFAGLSAEQRAAIRSWTEKLKAEPEPERVVAPFRPLESLAEALADYGKDCAGDENSAGAEKSEGADGDDPPAARKPEERGARRTFLLLIFLLTTCAILLAVFWLRWNRGWKELESGLSTRQDAVIEHPQLQVPAAEMEKLIIHRVDPDYPAEARHAKLQTVIALDVIVGKDGSVVSVHPLNGPDVLGRAAVDALRWWKFEPYRVSGAPTVVETTLAVEFKP
jgi:TonB family protein